MERKFEIGNLIISKSANNVLDTESFTNAVERHSCGDWGNISEDAKKGNEYALKRGEQLFSSYRDVNGVKFYIITEADRSVTTILLPGDY